MTSWLVLLLVALTAFRLCRLIAHDVILRPTRLWLVRRYPPTNMPIVRDETGIAIPGSGTVTPHPLVAFISCAWCTSVWITLALLIAVHFLGLLNSWQLLGIAWLACAAVVGIVSDWTVR